MSNLPPTNLAAHPQTTRHVISFPPHYHQRAINNQGIIRLYLSNHKAMLPVCTLFCWANCSTLKRQSLLRSQQLEILNSKCSMLLSLDFKYSNGTLPLMRFVLFDANFATTLERRTPSEKSVSEGKSKPRKIGNHLFVPQIIDFIMKDNTVAPGRHIRNWTMRQRRCSSTINANTKTLSMGTLDYQRRNMLSITLMLLSWTKSLVICFSILTLKMVSVTLLP